MDIEVPYVTLDRQYLDHRDVILAAIDRVLTSGQHIMGEDVREFEKRFSELCGTKHAVAVANGTDALVLAMKVLGIGEGDEVITCPNSYFASASAIVLAGARPTFVDVKDDQTLDPACLEKALTPKTKAIMPVHLTGKCADMNPIREFAKTHGLYVIEDAAQAVAAHYHGVAAGALGDIGCFSLHPLKNLNAAGDAGIIVTNNDEWASQLRVLRNHGGISRDEIVRWGYNSRLDTIQAAILNVRLNALHSIVEKRRSNARFYRERLASQIMCPEDAPGCFDVYHLFVIQTPQRDQLKTYLADCNIQTAIHYPIPIHLQKATRNLGYPKGSFPNVERQADQILSIPVHQHLTQEQLEHTATSILEFLKEHGG